mgnify:CR=1 FL=1|jgi:hypothetical protein
MDITDFDFILKDLDFSSELIFLILTGSKSI